MNRAFLLIIIAVVGAVLACGQQKQNDGVASARYPYSAALITTISSIPGHTDLLVFPFQGKAFRIPIHSASGPFIFSPDGKALYGQCTMEPVGTDKLTGIALCRIDLKTNTVTPLPGSSGLYAANLAVSIQEDHIVVSGLFRRNGDVRGLFDLDIPRGSVIPIRAQVDLHAKSGWGYLSLSPDGKRAVAVHDGRVELIDMARHTAEPLQETLFIAAWSPDGRWLGALEKGDEGRTILMDARSLKQQRILGPSELDWSPDSRCLLGLKKNDGCGHALGTLEAINIRTGERTTILSSACQVNQATTGWVSADIWPK